MTTETPTLTYQPGDTVAFKPFPGTTGTVKRMEWAIDCGRPHYVAVVKIKTCDPDDNARVGKIAKMPALSLKKVERPEL